MFKIIWVAGIGYSGVIKKQYKYTSWFTTNIVYKMEIQCLVHELLIVEILKTTVQFSAIALDRPIKNRLQKSCN